MLRIAAFTDHASSMQIDERRRNFWLNDSLSLGWVGSMSSWTLMLPKFMVDLSGMSRVNIFCRMGAIKQRRCLSLDKSVCLSVHEKNEWYENIWLDGWEN
jgi:hypothetical protein